MVDDISSESPLVEFWSGERERHAETAYVSIRQHLQHLTSAYVSIRQRHGETAYGLVHRADLLVRECRPAANPIVDPTSLRPPGICVDAHIHLQICPNQPTVSQSS